MFYISFYTLFSVFSMRPADEAVEQQTNSAVTAQWMLGEFIHVYDGGKTVP